LLLTARNKNNYLRRDSGQENEGTNEGTIGTMIWSEVAETRRKNRARWVA